MPRNTANPNLLVIEDNIGDARLIKEILKDTSFSQHEITFAHTLDEIRIFNKSHFEVIVLDLHLSDVKPEKTFQIINAAFRDTPIIVLTGLKDDRLAAKIVRQGAQDYLVKGTFDSETLQRSLKYAIYRKRAEKKLALQKYTSRKLKTRADNFETESIRLAKINKAKDVFLSIASHQLRTPATAVKQYLGMVLQGYAGELNEGVRSFLETAYQSNERQLKIVDDLLKVARLDAGHVILRKAPVDVVALMKEIIAELSQAIAIKNQHVSFEPNPTSVIANMDSDNMRMVFENLIDNASKYSEENAKITVSVDSDNSWVICTIKDSGIGISPQDQRKLFQKFARLDDSFTYAPNGSGLGLYWAKEIVRLHDGDISLHSTKDKGSTFKVKLPV